MMTHPAFPDNPARFLLPGPAGQLEVMTDCPETPVAAALICHPNPVQGGTMDNKVVTTMAKAFQALGCATLRFNYRGVGESEGVCEGRHYPEAGELADALFLYHWLEESLPGLPIYAAGFSFGSYIAASVADRKSTKQLLTIAPTVNLAPYSALMRINCPWLIVQGDEDDLVSAKSVKIFSEEAPQTIRYIEMAGAGHFFHGRLIELREILQHEIAALNLKE